MAIFNSYVDLPEGIGSWEYSHETMFGYQQAQGAVPFFCSTKKVVEPISRVFPYYFPNDFPHVQISSLF